MDCCSISAISSAAAAAALQIKDITDCDFSVFLCMSLSLCLSRCLSLYLSVCLSHSMVVSRVRFDSLMRCAIIVLCISFFWFLLNLSRLFCCSRGQVESPACNIYRDFQAPWFYSLVILFTNKLFAYAREIIKKNWLFKCQKSSYSVVSQCFI